MSFKLNDLPYSYDALEPYIDSKTMEIHHSKHHAAYTSKLNGAIENTELDNATIEEILVKGFDKLTVRNNGGGYYNHNLFWTIMSPNGGGEPTGDIAEAIQKLFGSFEEFKKQFSDVAITVFGSGWVWLCVKPNKELYICKTVNQDNPLMPNGCGNRPVLCLDVWEHAYYLKYQNKRPDYIKSFFQVINWEEVNRLFNL